MLLDVLISTCAVGMGELAVADDEHLSIADE